MSNKISGFFGEYRFLSNFQFGTIQFEGILYPTTEHAFQATKTLDIQERIRISEMPQPKDARKAGKTLKLRPDWESIKIDVMKEVCKRKFQIPELREKLKATGDAELIEENTWGDKFWGVCDGVGENNLGKILMEIRASL